jgi:hypothetical protein
MLPERLSEYRYRALAGIEAGVLGGLAMLCWMVAAAIVERRPLWAIPSVLGAAFYGSRAFEPGFGAPALAGLALLVFTAGLLGLAFGLLVGDSFNRPRVVLLGVLSGLAWFYLSRAVIGYRTGILGLLSAPPGATVLGHVLYGLVLGGYPGRLRSARLHFEDGGETPEAGPDRTTPIGSPDSGSESARPEC